MSLVICSNDIPKGLAGTSEFQAPFSWSNHLQQPLRIPPNSSVAVSSLKINKDGTYSVGPANKWYGYYGKELSAGLALEETTSAPCLTDLGIKRNTDVTTDELAVLIQDGMNRAVPNPESFGQATCTVERDPTTQEFKGFKSEFKALGNASSLNVLPTTWENSYQKTMIDGLIFDSSTNRLTAAVDKSEFNVAIGTDNPLALNEGEYIVQTDNAANVSWAMGLTRPWTTGFTPEYLHEAGSEIIPNQNLFGDFIVGAFVTGPTVRAIQVFHAVYDTGAGHDPNKPMRMIEVDYTTGGGTFTDSIAWTKAKAAIYTKCKMDVHGEKMRIELYNATTTKWETLVEFANANASATKGKIMKPVADTCRNLYPLAFISASSVPQAPPDRYLTVEKFGGRDTAGLKYGKTDWWGQLVGKGLQRQYAEQVDMRPYNNAADLATAHDYLGIVGGFVDKYEFVLVIKPDEVLYKETEQAAASVMLGFPNIPVLYSANITANATGGGYWVSLVAPELRSTTSLFVRLNSLPVNTFNAGTSGQSKIIYSAPRFSTGTDKSTGAMFYESPQRTYVSLNNSTELIVNTFDIDIVNADETVASDLLGKSVVVLHIKRDSELS